MSRVRSVLSVGHPADNRQTDRQSGCAWNTKHRMM